MLLINYIDQVEKGNMKNAINYEKYITLKLKLITIFLVGSMFL